MLISLTIACKKNLSVEETAQQWVELFYNSEFNKAKLLSTQITKNLIDTIAMELLDEEEIIAFQIIDMKCVVKGDSAICSYLYKEDLEGSEAFEEKIHLINTENQWLVDEPLTGEPLTDEEMEQIFEEYEEMLKEEIQNTQENE